LAPGVYETHSFDQWVLYGCPTHWGQTGDSTTSRPLYLDEFLCDDLGHILVPHLLRFEQLQTDLAVFLEKYDFGLNAKKLPRLNTSTRARNYRSFYTDPAAVRRVRELFHRDLERFNYDF